MRLLVVSVIAAATLLAVAVSFRADRELSPRESVEKPSSAADRPLSESPPPGGPHGASPVTGENPRRETDHLGVVSGTDGEPVAGARVDAFEIDSNWSLGGRTNVARSARLASTITNANGSFMLSIDSSRAVALVASAEGFVSGSAVSDGASQVLLSIGFGQICEFHVVDEHDAPIANAEVRMIDRRSDSPASTIRMSNALGTAAVTAGPGSAFLIRAPGHVSAYLRAPPSDGHARIVLRSAARICGVVVDGRGFPVSGVRVSLRGSTEALWQSQTTRERGQFAFDGIGPEYPSPLDWVVSVRRRAWIGSPVDVEPGDLNVRIRIQEAAGVSGTVVYPDGEPAPLAHIGSAATTESDGTFRIDEVRPGRRRISATAPSRRDRRVRLVGSTWVTLAPGEALMGVQIVLGPSTRRSWVLAHVIDEVGAPVVGAIVRAGVNGTDLAEPQAATNHEGAALIRLHAPPETPVQLSAQWRDASGRTRSARAPRELRSRSRPPIPSVELRVSPPPQLDLMLIDGAGSPIPLAREHIRIGGAGVGREGWTTDNRLLLSHLKPSHILVTVPGYARRRLVVAPEGRPIVTRLVQLVEHAVISGDVYVADGAPPARGITATATVSSEGRSERFRAPVDADGHFRIVGLPSGRVDLRVFAGRELVWWQRVAVLGGQRLQLRSIRLAEAHELSGRVTDESALPIARGYVVVEDLGGHRVATADVGAAGGFSVRIPEGIALRLFLRSPGFALHMSALQGEVDEPISLVLAPGTRVRVFTDDIREPGRYWVRLRDAVTTEIVGRRIPEDEPRLIDAPGVHLFADVPVGRIEVSLETALKARSRTVTTRLADTIEVRFAAD